MISHPNFEAGVAQAMADTGIVDTTLGVDDKPVYAGGTLGTTTNASDFNEWYNDTPGVNLSTSHSIMLDDTVTPGIFVFEDNTFFPIDGMLWGNETNANNYHFTYEIQTTFTYEMADNQYFTFTGDDDLWVFINDELVIDLGGVHGSLTDTIFLNTLGLVDGRIYELDIFYAERQTTSANFGVETNINLITDEPGDDLDEDGVPDTDDNCIATPNGIDTDLNTPEIEQPDADSDGIGDACDVCPNDDQNMCSAEDIDGDEVLNADDNCPAFPNPDQADEDSDDIGDVCDPCLNDPNNMCSSLLNDADGDGIPDNWDNCPEVENSLQEDFDGDGIGDICDECTDSDQDGLGDPGFDSTCEEDNCPFFANPGQEDLDDDGIGDRCDAIPGGATTVPVPAPPLGGPGPGPALGGDLAAIGSAPSADIPVANRAPKADIVPKGTSTTPTSARNHNAVDIPYGEYDEEVDEGGCSTNGNGSNAVFAAASMILVLWRNRRRRVRFGSEKIDWAFDPSRVE